MTLLEALRTIKDNGPTIDLAGICDNIGDLLKDKEHLSHMLYQFKSLYLQWPEFSGRVVFPVPSPYIMLSPGDVYGISKGTEMWDKDSEYGSSRWRLLNWCINKLENPDG